MSGGEGSGDWLLAQEFFERGDPAFVDHLRDVEDADALGAFATRWLADRRPEARHLLFAYLDRPLNAYRHEALVKRLFKQAEAAGDDALMARFLVAFDRSTRRVRGRQSRTETLLVATELEANTIAASWRDQGFDSVGVWQNWQNWQKKWQVWGRWSEPTVTTQRETAMPRGTMKTTHDALSWDSKTRSYQTFAVPDWVFALRLNPQQFRGGGRIPQGSRPKLARRRLFSVATRYYLRRRAWRYFRKLGRTHPERYLPAVGQALTLYRDEDVADGLALIDNWGLIHILFGFSPCLSRDDRQWKVAAGHTLAELEPAPRYRALWKASPRTFVELLIQARCRAVRGWAIQMIRRDLAAITPVFPLEERLGLLVHDDPDVVRLVADLLRDDPGLNDIPIERWLRLLEIANPAILDELCALVGQLVPPQRVALVQAVACAMARPLPVARLGLSWLKTRTPRDEADCRSLLALGEAECEVLRTEMVRWAAVVLAKSEIFRSEWVLEWLDCRHRDVRAEGWNWFRGEPRVRDDVTIWRRLMETPYDDVRMGLIAELETRTQGSNAVALERGDLDPDMIRLMWASVLLNIHRGNRTKPIVVRQLLRRIERQPTELPGLLPLLAVALRSVRGPEWRAGLSAVVQLAERDPSALGLIREAFPELQFV